MDRHANAPTHDEAVDQRHKRLGIARDATVEPVFLPPEGQLLVMAAGAPEIVHQPDVAPGTEGALASPGDHHPLNGAILLPARQCRIEAFEPEAQPWEKTLIKYEWRATLRRLGVIRDQPPANRFWDGGFAPPPPPRG